MMLRSHTFRRSRLWSRPSTTLSPGSGIGTQVRPPSLRVAPGSLWHRLLFWLIAPAPQDVAPPLNRLPGARTEFLATLSDIHGEEAQAMRLRIGAANSLRELWHARAEVFRVVGVAHNETVASQRLTLLNRHFPSRAQRPQFAPL